MKATAFFLLKSKLGDAEEQHCTFLFLSKRCTKEMIAEHVL